MCSPLKHTYRSAHETVLGCLSTAGAEPINPHVQNNCFHFRAAEMLNILQEYSLEFPLFHSVQYNPRLKDPHLHTCMYCTMYTRTEYYVLKYIVIKSILNFI